MRNKDLSESPSLSRSPSAPDHISQVMTSINRSLSTGLHTRNGLRSVVFVDDDILSIGDVKPHNRNNRVVGILKNGGGRAVVEDGEVEKVRGCEERSDELKWRVYWISTYTTDTSICNVAAAKFECARSGALVLTISNTYNTTFHATRFARRRSSVSTNPCPPFRGS